MLTSLPENQTLRQRVASRDFTGQTLRIVTVGNVESRIGRRENSNCQSHGELWAQDDPEHYLEMKQGGRFFTTWLSDVVGLGLLPGKQAHFNPEKFSEKSSTRAVSFHDAQT